MESDRLKVLVVDDELGMRLAVERALKKYRVHLPDVNTEVEFDIEQAASGEEALEKIESSQPDILLLDHKLPHMSGLDVLDHIAEKQYDFLTVMITAYASLETAINAIKSGAYNFLAKPFTPDELKAAVYKAAKHLTLQRQAKKLAEEKRQFRFQLISIVAHELKAPLAAIQQYLEILKDRPSEKDDASYSMMVDRSLLRLNGMRKLITDLLDMTRIESGRKKRELVELDLCAEARSAVENVLPSAAERNIAVELNASGPVSMTADRSEIEIVLNNLLTNAVKYNKEDGKAYLNIAEKDDKVIITCTDTGIGMTNEEASRLFNDFVRIRNEKTEKILGSGLGLSIVKKIALLYGGEVSVAGKPDVGSTFMVVLKK